jgi:hypothetical protein
VLLGSTSESVMQPEWADDDHLYLVSARSGWWNLYLLALTDGSLHSLAPRDEEFSSPLWLLGLTTYGVLEDGRLAVTHGNGHELLSVLDPATGSLVSSGLDHAWDTYVMTAGSTVVSVVRSDALPWSVVAVDLTAGAADHGSLDIVRRSSDVLPDPAYLPTAESRSFTGVGGRDIHAFVYHPMVPGENNHHLFPDGRQQLFPDRHVPGRQFFEAPQAPPGFGQLIQAGLGLGQPLRVNGADLFQSFL